MNGYTIKCEVSRFDGTRVIMGEQERSGRLVYVVSIADDGAETWHSGHYFDGMETDDNRAEAMNRFLSYVETIAQRLT
jgi:hypothetical protein